MIDAWMRMWTNESPTAVTGWTAISDAVPSVTDGVPPMWLTSMGTPFMAPAMMGAAMAGAASATWFGMVMGAPKAQLAMVNALTGAGDTIVDTPKRAAAAKKPAKASTATKRSAPVVEPEVAAKRASKPVAANDAGTSPVAKPAAKPKTAPKAKAPVKSAPKAKAASVSKATPVGKTTPASKAAPAKKTPASATKAKPVAAAKKQEPVTTLDSRPAGLDAPRAGKADDLKKITGVGPKLETTLNDLGIYHFDQIADWTPAQIEWVDSYLRFKGRIARDKWLDQAKIFASQKA